MFLWFWTVILLGLSGATDAPDPGAADAPEPARRITSTAEPAEPARPAKPAAPGSPGVPGVPASPASPGAPGDPAYSAEPQVPTGRFTTAAEVKPILTATRPNWVALRDYNGQDLVYVTQIMSWRCGLVGLRFAVNDGLLADWPLPPCHEESATPNALRPEDGLPYRAFPSGSVRSVTVELIYDDLTRDTATYPRAQVLMP
ncbi:hypothetical protein OB2597_02187 [Pseudooceanicola batsensis HTCC2597]|uniref:Uncharacterized protein n=1 Tax=Pseudooceanicola batsensis (strain ATCC BAA-863 / DSM 15984 / KCTC 12145 / HTCC2597) TaxID=252305 RepID=A3TX31_PSEBH|nr:hypothetical protein [Pseudooceanicola batsensis]EAQ03391.1 hypothetical protein OB2597_02187 [Pseudooceanicola batsensis HTCC2597]